jgi:hypothetical protein
MMAQKREKWMCIPPLEFSLRQRTRVSAGLPGWCCLGRKDNHEDDGDEMTRI